MKKKNLISIVALGLSGVASAQSSVTLFGVVDASISHYSNSARDAGTGLVANAAGVPVWNPLYINRGTVSSSRTALASGSLNMSRLGFRGTEDLGGGLAASFWFQSGILNDDGSKGLSDFENRSTVSLSGGFGEIRLGRDYTPTFWNDTIADPFNEVGVGMNLLSVANVINTTGGKGGFGGNASYVRASNSISYFLPPDLGGLYGQLMYAFPETTKYTPGTATPPDAKNANQARTGRYVGGRLGYAGGPLDIAVAYGNTIVGDQYYAGTTDRVAVLNLGASYDFGPVKLFGELSRTRSSRDYAHPPGLDAQPDADLTGYLFGATAPVGAGLIRASYARVRYDYHRRASLDITNASARPSASKLAVSYVYNLSKRTALYATVARLNNRNGATLSVGGPAFYADPAAAFRPRNSTGYEFGIRNFF